LIILITGCRSGFGLLAAVAAAKAGHTVYAGLRDLKTAAGLQAAAEGLDVIPVQLDVTKADERQAVVERIIAEKGRIDGLVNNAGIALGGPLELLTEDELRYLFDVNVFGAFAMTNLCLPSMRESGHGVIINLSSVSGRMVFPGLGAYAASKFALEGLSEGLRHELKQFGVHVYVIEPGPFKTDIWNRNRRVGRHVPDPPDGPYGRTITRVGRAIDKMVETQAEPPDSVVQRVIDLLESPGAKAFRHPMGKGMRRQLLLVSVLPFSIVEHFVQRVVQGRKPKRR